MTMLAGAAFAGALYNGGKNWCYSGIPQHSSRGVLRVTPPMLKTTPFHLRTAPLCISHAWRRWAGYVVASSYELSHEREYQAIRTAAALFDISPLFKYAISGPDAS